MDQDPFAFVDVEAGALSPSQRALILASPFINDDSNQALDFEKGDKGKDPVDPLQVYNKPLDRDAEGNLEDMDILEIATIKGIRFDPPKWHRAGGYDDVKKSSMCIPLSENDKEKLPVHEQGQAAPEAPIDLFEVFKPSLQELTTKLENMDILEIAVMKGIRFDHPRWHRAGGYDSKGK